MNYTVQNLENSEVVLTIQIPAAAIETNYSKALTSITADFKMDGFRPGTVPENLVIQKIGSLTIWEEALRETIPSVYLEILTESKIPALGRPRFNITKITDKSDAEVTVTTAVMPEIPLPDYASIAQQVYTNTQVDPVTESDVTNAIIELRKLRYQRENTTTVETAAPAAIDESELPELTPEYLSGFGQDITSLEILNKKMRHNLEHERIHQLEDKKRAELVALLLENAPFAIPTILVDYEINLMLRQYEHDLSVSGISLDEYLKYTNKTIDHLRTEITEPASKRAKTQLLLDKIAQSAEISPDATKVESELAQLTEQYKDQGDFDATHAKSYLEQVYTNQAVFAYLEKLGGYTPHDHEAWDNAKMD